jgi:hypothetical protein
MKYGGLSCKEVHYFLFNVLPGGSCSEYLSTAAYVEEVDKLL